MATYTPNSTRTSSHLSPTAIPHPQPSSLRGKVLPCKLNHFDFLPTLYPLATLLTGHNSEFCLRNFLWNPVLVCTSALPHQKPAVKISKANRFCNTSTKVAIEIAKTNVLQCTKLIKLCDRTANHFLWYKHRNKTASVTENSSIAHFQPASKNVKKRSRQPRFNSAMAYMILHVQHLLWRPKSYFPEIQHTCLYSNLPHACKTRKPHHARKSKVNPESANLRLSRTQKVAAMKPLGSLAEQQKWNLAQHHLSDR